MRGLRCVVPAEPGEGAVPSDATTGRVTDLLATAVHVLRAYHRRDLVERLERERRRFAQPECNVLVVGEFKKGKS